MDTPENKNLIIEVTIKKDSIIAVDGRRNTYKVQSMMLGAGSHRQAIKYTKNLLGCTDQYRAEILPNGKLNIL